MKTNSFKNLILTLVCLVGTTGSVFAQAGQTNSQEVKKAYVKYVCDNAANTAIDLALDVIGNGFSAEAGKWELVKNDVTTTNEYTEDKVIREANNVFVLSGKLPGEYTFVFTATGVSACIPVGHKRLAKVVILETPKDLSTGLSLCPGKEGQINLKTIIPVSLKDKVTIKTTVSPVSAGSVENDIFKVDSKFQGVATVEYSVEYKADAKSAACATEASITINVSRDENVPTLKGEDTYSYCINEVPDAINLNELLTSLAPKGEWSMNTTVASSGVTLDKKSGNVIFKSRKLGEYTFTYTYGKPEGECYEAGEVKFTIKITDNLKSEFQNKEKTVCKNKTPNAVLNMLRDGLNVDIPLSSGTWRMVKEITAIDVSDGLFEVEKARAGKYEYEFKVSTAAEICELAGEKATLKLSIIDPNATQDGRMQYCIADLANRTTDKFALSSLVPNLPESDVVWEKVGNDFSSFEKNKGEISYEELRKAGKGTYKFIYTYDAGDCGTATGNVYLAVTDKLDVSDKVVLRYCRPDMPKPINLTQAIGVDVKGTWTMGEGTTGVLDKDKRTFTEEKNKSGEQTYTLVFTPNKGSCTKIAKITVTIQVSDNKFE